MKQDSKDVNKRRRYRTSETLKQFRYLGSVITQDGRCDQEIKTRIVMAKAAFNERRTRLEGKLNCHRKRNSSNHSYGAQHFMEQRHGP